MNKITNIGVQLMPVVLILASVAYYYVNATALSVTCLFLGVFLWAAIYSIDAKR
jgi:heme O synthase-like polyprenyltransferase